MYKLFKESFVVMSEADKIKLLQAFYYEGRTMSLDFIFQKCIANANTIVYNILRKAI